MGLTVGQKTQKGIEFSQLSLHRLCCHPGCSTVCDCLQEKWASPEDSNQLSFSHLHHFSNLIYMLPL